MNWHLIHDRGWGTLRRPGTATPEQLLQGTLLLETDLSQAAIGMPILFLADRAQQTNLTLTMLEDGRLYLVHRRGGVRIGLSVPVEAGRARITYGWDKATRSTLLSLEGLETGRIRQAQGGMPPCMTAADLRALARCAETTSDANGSSVVFRGEWVACGEGRHLPGQTAMMAGNARIATPRGEVPLDSLAPGDLVLTLDAGVQPVIWTGRARVPALGSYRPVRLVSPFLGGGSDLLVVPSQRMVITGSDIEYLVGEREMMIEARHLVNGSSAVWDDTAPTVVWFGLLLAGHHLVLANGCPTETLNIGRLAESPGIARTTSLGALVRAGRLPVHRALVMRATTDYEAMAITSALARRSAPVTA